MFCKILGSLTHLPSKLSRAQWQQTESVEEKSRSLANELCTHRHSTDKLTYHSRSQAISVDLPFTGKTLRSKVTKLKKKGGRGDRERTQTWFKIAFPQAQNQTISGTNQKICRFNTDHSQSPTHLIYLHGQIKNALIHYSQAKDNIVK